MISEETIQRVKEKASILELVQEVAPVRRQGARFVALCPFHKEKSPSFHIREEEKSYYCFGCGASGNIFTFIMQLRGLSFPEAIEELAARYRVPVVRTGKQTTERKTLDDKRHLFDLNSHANQYFRERLLKAPQQVLDYVEGRGIKKETIQKYSIGFSGTERTGLTEYLKSKGASVELLLKAGLSKRGQDGSIFDTFRNRLVFPIFIDPKRIAGFGGRVIPFYVPPELKDSIPKYLNSPETAIYEKRRVLFGVPQAAQAIRDKKEVYVVEGYMDVVGLAQVGIENAVATCGTSLTHEHVLRLMRLSKKVVVLFDGDRAGRAAAARAFPIFLNSPVDVIAAFVPEGEDPDSVARAQGDKTSEYLKNLPRLPLLDCYLAGIAEREGVDKLSSLGDNAVSSVTKELATLIRQVKDPIVRERLTEKIASKLKIQERFLKTDASSESGSAGEIKAQEVVSEKKKTFQELSKPTQAILYSAMAHRNEIVPRILRNPVLMHGIEDEAKRFLLSLSSIIEQPESAQKESVVLLLKESGPSWLAAWKQAHSMVNDPGSNLLVSYEESVKTVERLRLELHLKGIEQAISAATSDEDKGHLLAEHIAVKKRVNELRG